jgi:hypothetical protein
MTKDKIKKAEELAEYIKGVTQKFPNIFSIEDEQIVNIFTFQEIMSDDFINIVMPELGNYYRQSVVSKYSDLYKVNSKEAAFLFFLRNSSTWGALKKKSEGQENLKLLINKILTFIQNDDSLKTSVKEEINYLIFFNDSDINKYVLSEMIKRGMFDLISSIHETSLVKVIDSIMLTGDYETISKVYDEFSSEKNNLKDYKGYPVVIINPNLTQDQKILIIKKTYKQKDTNKYLDLIRDNMKDMNDFDSFIEATIIQNNRIKEKDDNIMATIERVMIGVRGQYFDISSKLSTYKNVNKFFKKYNKYFTDEVCLSGLAENNYYKSRNYRRLVAEISKHVGLVKKLQFAKLNTELASEIFKKENIVDMLKQDLTNDEERALLSYLTERYIGGTDRRYGGKEYSLEIMSIDNLAEYANKYPDIFTRFLATSTMVIDSELGKEGTSSYSWDKSEKAEKFTLHKRADFISQLSEENFNKVEIIESIFLNSFGLNVKENYRNSYNATESIKNMGSFYRQLTKALELKNPKINKLIEEKLIKFYEDEDNVRDNLFEIVSKIISEGDKSFFSELLLAMKLNNITDLPETFFKKFIAIVEVHFPGSYETIKANFSKLITDLKVIISIH